MALNLTKPTPNKKEISQAYRQINTYLQKMREDGKISDETLHVINDVSEDKGIPANTNLYMSFSTFIHYIKDTYLLHSGVVFVKKKNNKNKEDSHNNSYSDNAYRLTDKPDPNQGSIILTVPAKRRGFLVVNPNTYPYTPSFIESFEPVMLDVINPLLFADNNRFSKPKEWINFLVMVVSNIGLELYLPPDFIDDWIIFGKGVTTFHFNTKPENVERKSYFVSRSILRLCSTQESLRKQLITHGIIPHTHEVESLEVYKYNGNDNFDKIIMQLNSFPVM